MANQMEYTMKTIHYMPPGQFWNLHTMLSTKWSPKTHPGYVLKMNGEWYHPMFFASAPSK